MLTAPTELPVRLDAVTLTANGVQILSDVSLVFAAGPPTVLVGPNGAGKSTILRAAAGLLTPTAGRISWGGRARTDGRRLALVSQRPVMLRRSAFANITYALAAAEVPRNRRLERAEQLLHQVGLTAQAGRPARRLSGGEQQRLALARALARDPEVLFLDEPTASLDPAATKMVEDIVVRFAALGVKIVMSTHDLGQAHRLAGDIILLVGGRVREQAEAVLFFTSPKTTEATAFLRGDIVL